MTIDFVGDIHGHAAALEAMLRQLGYRETRGAWRHADRRMVFVGDFIDRGPEQLRTIDMVRRMIDAGSAEAVLGNHELSCIQFATPDPVRPKKFLRIRGSKNTAQHQVFLDAVGLDSPLHREVVTWMKSLPLWLEVGGVQAVHACWHPGMQALLAPWLDGHNRFTEEGIVAAATRGTDAYLAVETLLKGIEVPLPNGMSFIDKDGNERFNTRIRWWDPSATTFRSAAIVGDDTAAIPDDIPLPPGMPTVTRPTMIGHYWLSADEPYLSSKLVACLDFSVAKGGMLCSYAYDGEEELSVDKMTVVSANHESVMSPAI